MKTTVQERAGSIHISRLSGRILLLKTHNQYAWKRVGVYRAVL